MGRVARSWLASLAACLLGACAGHDFVRSPELTAEAVVFRYRDSAAHIVQVSGSWQSNFHLRGRDWTRDTRVGRMTAATDGVWELRVPLGPGRYEYLFLVDGRFWELDPANPQRAPDGAGGQVSLLVVP
jgi:hypothetical protein